MNRIDASDHYDLQDTSQTPSLLTIIIDTNPRAWAALNSTIPISKAVANILVFVNAHLAFGNENQVAILAAHSRRALWLYPPSPETASSKLNGTGAEDGDVPMSGVDGAGAPGISANKYPQFAQIEISILSSLRALINDTSVDDLHPTTLLSGALSLALGYINKCSLAFAAPKLQNTDSTAPTQTISSENNSSLHARILVLSVSDSDSAQYIPTMNAVFAASHARIPIDTLSLHGTPSFLQQAAYITSGIFLSAGLPADPAATTNGASANGASNGASSKSATSRSLGPHGLLTYLTFAFLPSHPTRDLLVPPTQDSVDFRAACFCHRNVVDTGFVCSICLSIFCEPPEGAECLTCGTKLALGEYGKKPAVIPRRKKKKKIAGNRVNGSTGARDDTGSIAGTPVPGQ